MTTVAFPSPAAINTASTTPTLHLSPSSSMRSSTSNSGSSLVSSHLGLRPPMPPSLSIPDIDTSSTSPVPFPRISQRRKLYRGIGTQPWHLKVSDSDSESDESATAAAARKSTKRQQTTTTVKTATPSPEAMPNFDPKRTYSESQIPSTSTPSALSATTVASFGPMIRKKSGEIVKSALKSPSQSSFGAGFGSGSRGGSSSPSTSASRISMPPTPTFSVRFDRQLEYVKLFRHQQKPAAVSHEGSPCDSETSDNDTFGQQSDGGLYRSSEDERIRAGLVMESVNIPLRDAMASTQERLGDLDVRLDQVVLSSDGRAVEGTVLVRNIAYEKWIAVRFTYDWWQTTSEVTARYLKSFSEENTDVFSFTIRLPEVTKRIDEKRLLFALRYTAGGRECWDNNRGENYHVRFKTEAKKQQQQQQQQRSETSNGTSKSTTGGATVSPGAARPPSWPMHANNVDQMAELRRELEKVVRDEEESSGVRAWDLLTVKLRARNMDIEEDRDVKKQATNANANDFSGRYDFKASSKVKWEAPKDIPRYGGPPPETAGIPFPLPSRHHTRSVSANAAASGSAPISGTTTTATATSTTPSLQLHQASWRSPRGSPRDHGTDSTASSPKFFIDPREAKHWKAPTPTGATGAAGTGRVRNHQRGGYFDSYMEGLSKMVFTPPTTSAPRVEEDDSSLSLIAIDVTTSSSRDSAITVTATATPNKREEGVLSDVVVPVTITEDADAAEMSSETESTSSSTTNTSSSHVTTNDIVPLPSPSIAAAGAGASSSIAEATRAIRFNSYPMDRTYLAVATTPTSTSPSTSSSSPSSAEGSASALLTVPQQASGWPLSPQGSSSSVLSTPSITSASSPSQCPSSPAELSDSMPSIHQLALGGGGGAGAPKPGVDSLDYNYLLQKFCYFTGNNVPDRHGLRVSYGSSHHRHSQSESTPLPSPLPSPTPSPAWDATRVVDAAAASVAAADISPASLAESRAAVVAASSKVPVPVLDDDMWSYDSSRTATTATTSDDSGHTTPTLSPKMQMQMRMSMSMTPAHAHAHAAHAHGTFSPFTLGSPGKRTPTQRPGPADHVEGFDFDFDVDVESTPRPRLQSTEYLVRPYRESL